MELVERVAESRRLSAREALRMLVEDEIAARAAQERGLDRRNPAAWRIMSARARLTADRLRSAARSRGLPTDEEVATLTAAHWAEVDRPPCVRVTHAIVLRPRADVDVPSARALARELRTALAGASEADFEGRARSLPRDPKLDVKVESLPPFTSDGRVVEGRGTMDSVFAEAAFSLGQPGDTSAVVETSFGFHVIRLLERLPERRMPLEARRVAFAEEVFAHRARELLLSRLEELRRATEVAVAPGAEQIMRSFTVARENVGAP